MASGVTGSVSVALHPLVILNISDHWIRIRSQEGRPMQGKWTSWSVCVHRTHTTTTAKRAYVLSFVLQSEDIGSENIFVYYVLYKILYSEKNDCERECVKYWCITDQWKVNQ